MGTLLTLTSGSVTALIDRLEKLGWASRNRHPDDRRKVVVTLTQKAWQIGQDELRPYLEAVDTAARQLSNDQRAVVVGFLDDLIDNVAHARARTSEAKHGVPSQNGRSVQQAVGCEGRRSLLRLLLYAPSFCVAAIADGPRRWRTCTGLGVWAYLSDVRWLERIVARRELALLCDGNLRRCDRFQAAVPRRALVA